MGEVNVVEDILTDLDCAPWRAGASRRGYASMVSLPLSLNDRTFGALNIYASEQDAFDKEEVELLSELAGDLSYGIGALRTKGERDKQAVALKHTGEQLSLLLESLPIIFYTSKAEGDFGLTYISSNINIFNRFLT
jgi:GAF domain-containing protein